MLVVVGPSSHRPGTHEVAAGGRLMAHAVDNLGNVSGLAAEVAIGWPTAQQRESASTVVFIGDKFPANRLPEPKRNLANVEEMMARGCGIVCVHYATGLLGEDVAPDGDHPLLRWIGGYFANRSCAHHQSIAKVFDAATIVPNSSHPVSRGCEQFTVHDEPYIRNYFGPQGTRPAENVSVIATSMLPPDNPRREAVAWGTERADGGRGAGIVMPHFYKNWRVAPLRRMIMNSIVWTAGLDVPAGGVESDTPDLTKYGAESIKPQPRS